MDQRPNVTLADSPETPDLMSPPRRYVTARYRVRVEALDERGAAHGTVVGAVQPLTPNEIAAVYGERVEQYREPERVTFVGGLPGELIEVELRWPLPWPGRKPARRIPDPFVRPVSVIEPSAARVAPRCPVFGECGGCQLQHMAYPDQLIWKTEQMRALLAQVGFVDAPVLPAIGSDSPWHYRNHMRFSVNRNGRLGLTARGTSHVLPLRACPIADERINEALGVLADVEHARPQLLVRHGEATGELLLQPTSSSEVRSRLEAIVTVVRDESFEEELGGHRFRIRPSSFFQTNTAQANVMARLVLDVLPAGLDVVLVDAYCGVGTFARLMAERVGRVIAIEESASAIRDARYNLREAPNVEIVQAKVEEVLPQMRERLDGLVIDPPRAGCQRSVIDALIARRVPRVVYVSCGPDTLARDLRLLCLESGAYRLVSLQPLDMFPQTAHIENIAVLAAEGGTPDELVPGGE